MKDHKGRLLVLEALTGKATEQLPVAPMTWGFNYCWKVAGLAPWELALGSHDTWHRAYLALYERHRPDIVHYEGCGRGEQDPTLIQETSSAWLVWDNNYGREYEMLKESLALRKIAPIAGGHKPSRSIETRRDADRVVPEGEGWGDSFLNGLKRLIDELGDRALVLPHHITGYISACYAFGFERSMEMMASGSELFTYTADRFASSDSVRMRQLREVGCDAVLLTDAWASCDIISPEMFDRYALPYQIHCVEAARAEGIKTIFWGEGNVIPVLDRVRALPIDAYAIEQTRKDYELTIAKLREAFGPERCLFGNLDSETLLRRNNPVEIAEAVREQVRMSGPGAPFVLSTGSPLPDDVEPEAVDTMIEAARQLAVTS